MEFSAAGTLAGLAFNVALPALWLMVLSRQVEWAPLTELAIGLFFPLAFGVGLAVRKRRFSPISAMAMASILLTGAVAAFATNRAWFIAKGAAVPYLVAICLAAARGRVAALLADFLRKGPVLHAPTVQAATASPAAAARFTAILRTTTAWLSLHFLLQGTLNAFWNAMLVTAAPGTTAFNEQYGELLARNLYLVAAPCAVSLVAIVAVTVGRLARLAGVGWKELFPR